MPQADPELRDPLVGARIDGRYTVHGTLGRGGMGVVYDGEHDELGRKVAIKVLNAAWASDPVAVARFLREARTASSLTHGNIVDVSDLGRLPDGRPYLVMPKISGMDLATLLQRSGPQPPKRVAELLAGVASALDLMHAKGYVHRDIKPENLMYVVREDGSETVMLLDFGIAALMMSNEPRLTRQGSIFGTPQYLPPEVWDGKVPDERGDVYALATVAFELMTGVLPFDAENAMHILPLKLKHDAPSMNRASGVTFPDDIEAVIARGLAREPDDRYASASEFVGALRDATARAPVSWRPGVMTQLETPRAPKPSGLEYRETIGSASLPAEPTELEVMDGEAARPRALSDEVLALALDPTRRAVSSVPPPPMTGRRVGYAVAIAALLTLLAVFAMRSSEAEHVATPALPARTPVAAAPSASPAPAGPLRQPVPVPTLPRVPSHAPPPASPPVTRALEPARAVRAHPAARPPSPASDTQVAAPIVQPVVAPPPAITIRPVAPPPAPAHPVVTTPVRDTAQAERLTHEGTAALLSGQVAHATELLRRATQADPTDAAAWRNLGLAYERETRARDAVEAYQHYLRLEPRGAQADKVRERVQVLQPQ